MKAQKLPCVSVDPFWPADLMMSITDVSLVKTNPCLIVAARPDHSGWVTDIPKYMHEGSELLYLGLKRNLGIDLDELEYTELKHPVAKGLEIACLLKPQKGSIGYFFPLSKDGAWRVY